MGRLFNSGMSVEESGIYQVTHETCKPRIHEVTCIAGDTFPACSDCSAAVFHLLRPAVYVTDHKHFKAAAIAQGPGARELAGSAGRSAPNRETPANLAQRVLDEFARKVPEIHVTPVGFLSSLTAASQDPESVPVLLVKCL
jgi:hypothetical protein